MNLAIDIGNTRTKFSVCTKGEILTTTGVDEFLPSHIDVLKKEYRELDNVILSTVKEYSEELKKALQQNFKKFIELGAETPLPIENCYESKETLGKDRIAAVVGAYDLFPNSDILIIDAGTAITYDLITSEGKYLGGNISPGIEMRFKALNQFTGKLPRIKKAEQNLLYGKTTEQAIRAGVQNGTVFEVDNTIDSFKNLYRNLIVVITGGDAKFFEKKLKNSFFVRLNLISQGLNRILDYNEENN